MVALLYHSASRKAGTSAIIALYSSFFNSMAMLGVHKAMDLGRPWTYCGPKRSPIFVSPHYSGVQY